jgi:hypothetical protein
MSGDLEVRVDLLVELEQAGALTSTALVLAVPPPFEMFEALCAQVGTVSSGSRFWIGDLLLFGEAVYGEEAAQAFELLKLSEDGRVEALRVARMIPPAIRRPGLSWWHHRLVSYGWLTPEERVELLDRCEAEGLTTRILEAIVRDLRDRDADSGGATTDDPPIVVDALIDAARALVRDAECRGAFSCEVPTERVVRLRELLREEEA